MAGFGANSKLGQQIVNYRSIISYFCSNYEKQAY
jgi:hypothetical protein